MYDLAVIGAGPAGATLARLLGERYRILLVDKRHLERPAAPRHPATPGHPATTDSRTLLLGKCCGGLLAPDAQHTLARFGLGVPKSILEDPQIFIVRTIDLKTRRERFYQRHYLNMNREAFDRWLVSLVPGKVVCRFQTVLEGWSDEGEYFTLHLSAGGRRYDEQARFIIGADGAFSKVRRLIGPVQPAIPTYIAIQEWFETPETYPYYSAVFDAEVTDFYSWTIPKEGSLIVGAAVEPGREANARFRLLKTKLADYGFSLKKTIKREGGYLLRPTSVRNLNMGQGRIALVGEAAGWISPSSAEGFSYAMRSAWLLAEALTQGTDHVVERYRRNSAKLKTNILLKNLKSPFMYDHWLRNAILASGVKAIDVCNRFGD